MGTKNKPGAHDCYGDAHPDEPMFILLGRDRHAPTLVWLWATLREIDDEDPAKVAEARKVTGEMIAWLDGKGKKAVGLAEAHLAAALELIRMANEGVKAFNGKTDAERLRQFLAASRLLPDEVNPTK